MSTKLDWNSSSRLLDIQGLYYTYTLHLAIRPENARAQHDQHKTIQDPRTKMKISKKQRLIFTICISFSFFAAELSG